MTLTIRSNDPYFELVERPFFVENNHTAREVEMDALEETLYVLWELTPMSRAPEWMRELSKTGSTLFRYGQEEAYIVRWIGDLTYEVIM